jgi:hypothetical protein
MKYRKAAIGRMEGMVETAEAGEEVAVEQQPAVLVRRLHLMLSLFSFLFFVVIFSYVFLRRRWVEVRLRASLKRALHYS